MKVDDMVFGFNDVRFEDLVSQTAIQTNEDKLKYQNMGYMVNLTESEFMSMFDLDPKMVCTYLHATPAVSISTRMDHTDE